MSASGSYCSPPSHAIISPWVTFAAGTPTTTQTELAIKMVIHLAKQKSLSPLPKLHLSSAFPISVNGTAIYTVMPGSHHPHRQPLATLFKINQAVICLVSSSLNVSVLALTSFWRAVDTISWTHCFLSLLETWGAC